MALFSLLVVLVVSCQVRAGTSTSRWAPYVQRLPQQPGTVLEWSKQEVSSTQAAASRTTRGMHSIQCVVLVPLYSAVVVKLASASSPCGICGYACSTLAANTIML